jgi:hypothetical protein
MRGGGGVFFNNEIHDMQAAVEIADDPGNSQFPQCYPHDLWIWNNTLYNVGVLVDNTNPLVHQGTDYFLRAPNISQDGFGYTPYPYPHWLTQ